MRLIRRVVANFTPKRSYIDWATICDKAVSQIDKVFRPISPYCLNENVAEIVLPDTVAQSHPFFLKIFSRELTKKILWSLLVLFLVLMQPILSYGQEIQHVDVVMFYSSSCTHCQQVLQETIPPLRTMFGSQLNLLLLDVGRRQMMDLYQVACDHFDVDDTLCGSVPAVIIGSDILIGSDQIEEDLLRLVEEGLAAGGVTFPPITGMQEAVEYIESFRNPAITSDAENTDTITLSPQSWYQHAADHPVEFLVMSGIFSVLIGSPILFWHRRNNSSLALGTMLMERFILVLSLACLLIAGSLLKPSEGLSLGNMSATITSIIMIGLAGSSILVVLGLHTGNFGYRRMVQPLLAGAGLIIALYMLRSEIGEQMPYCGPMGDCVTVQQSSYAWLFGWLPIGAFGIAGYLALISVHTMTKFTKGRINQIITRLFDLMMLFGVLFSAYLTFLEMFIIKAMCTWCLTSAMIMVLIFWVYAHEKLTSAENRVTHNNGVSSP